MKISASILTADFANLALELNALEQAGTDIIHLDIMDGHFVPNLTFGPSIIKSLRPLTKLRFDVHLMVMQPENLVDDYIKAGADMIIVHPESTIHLDRLLGHIKTKKIKAGVALNPSTTLDVLEYILDKIDLVLIMTVNPGFGGQPFIVNQLSKIKQLKSMVVASSKPIEIAVDGGINDNNAAQCIEAGADILVSGGFILYGVQCHNHSKMLYNTEDFKKRVSSYKTQVNSLKNNLT